MTGGLVGFLIVIVAIVILIITIHRRRHSETFMKREVSWLFTHITFCYLSFNIPIYSLTRPSATRLCIYHDWYCVGNSQAIFFVVFNVILFWNWVVLSKMLLTPWFHKKLLHIVSLLIFLWCFYVNKHGRYFLVFLYRGLAVMSRLKSSIQLNPERKITSHCNRLPHRKSSSTTLCIASKNNNLAIFRTINPHL